MKRVVVVLLLAGLVPLVASGCVGTGSPWTKQLRVAVVGLTGDGSGEVPLAGATVTVTAASTGGSGSTSSQTLATGPDGVATFRVEPGYTYNIAATANGYSNGQVSVTVGFAAGTITRKITLAVSAT
jgi:hypothetical protein